MGLTPAQFYDLTLWEFQRYQVGYAEKVYDQWRIARWQASIQLVSVIGNKAPSPMKLCPLPGDDDQKDEEVVHMSADQAIAAFAAAYGAVKANPKEEQKSDHPPTSTKRFDPLGRPIAQKGTP